MGIILLTWLKRFAIDELGQDLAEYCLITALLALVALGVFIHFSGGMQNLWGNANSALAAGNSAAVNTTATPASAPKP